MNSSDESLYGIHSGPSSFAHILFRDILLYSTVNFLSLIRFSSTSALSRRISSKCALDVPLIFYDILYAVKSQWVRILQYNLIRVMDRPVNWVN